MAKRGRPKSTNLKEHRTHCVVLTEKAELIKRAIDKARNPGWFSRFVSEKIVDDFSSADKEEAYLIYRINHLQQQRADIEKEINDVAYQLQTLRHRRAQKEAEIVMETQ